MTKFIITVFILFLCSSVYAAPTDLMTIIPVATADTKIKASEENARNTAISTPYNAHTHTGIIGENALIVGSTNGEYSTITAAMNAATTGDTILVHNGTYTETITFTKDNVALKAIGAAESTIITQAADDVIAFSTYSGCTVDGFTISVTAADGTADYLVSSANDSTTDYNTVKNCILDWGATTNFGVSYLINCTNGNTRFIHNTITATNTYAGTDASSIRLLGLTGDDNYEIAHNNITLTTSHTEASGDYDTAIYVDNTGKTAIIRDNDITVTSTAATTHIVNGILVGNGTTNSYNNNITVTASSTATASGIARVGGTAYSYHNTISCTTADGDGECLDGVIASFGDTLAGDKAKDTNVVNWGTMWSGGIPDNGTGQRIIFAGNTASNGVADTFIAFESSEGEIGDISGTADSGVIAYNTFLGSHYTRIDLLPGDVLENGMVLEMTGQVVEGTRLAKTRICKAVGSTAVYGVYGGTKTDERSLRNGKAIIPENVKDRIKKAKKERKDKEKKYREKYELSEDELLENEYKIHLSLGLGAGYVLVSNANGDIQAGDLLESDGNGYAQKQASTTIKSSTIGKAVENVDWSLEPDTKKIIGCVLFCG